ncbi:MAG: saccharopine dehydrogenase [Candidatus Competibacteraceae bacterium]|nr:saccharopine dehydrogenase [Candidatus Competibacteraceae bacterium]
MTCSDIVVWGATGFTGRLVAEYLLDRYGVDGDLRWAIGGRNPAKLKQIRAELGGAAESLPILIGDSNDPASLDKFLPNTAVVCSTVGPFAQYGTELVAACVRHGTHYCDLSGEVHWMQRMIDTYQRQAQESDARIVHACGFDSIPSDLGCLLINQVMRERHGQPCHEVKLRVRKMKGTFSGGTFASMLNALEEAKHDPVARRALGNPYALNPEGARSGPDGPDQQVPAWDVDIRTWTAPFVMASINTRVVRRSNALMNNAYGSHFRYSEAVTMGTGPLGLAKATALTAALGGFLLSTSFRPSRALLNKWLFPQPGEGPSREQREQGYFEIILIGKHPEDASLDLRAKVTADRDPGYGATCKMLGESAVCLAKDTDALNVGGGFWTPASSMGTQLIERLKANAGMTFELTE